MFFYLFMCLLDFMTVQAFAVLSIMNGVYHPRQLPPLRWASISKNADVL